MNLDQNHPVVKLCAEGIMREGETLPEAARELYQRAWEKADNDFYKCIAAHYLARVQENITAKLAWDKTALQYGLASDKEEIEAWLPSLYLNIAKGYEETGENVQALDHYRMAESYTGKLPDDGYGNMIRRGIQTALERMQQ